MGEVVVGEQEQRSALLVQRQVPHNAACCLTVAQSGGQAAANECLRDESAPRSAHERRQLPAVVQLSRYRHQLDGEDNSQ